MWLTSAAVHGHLHLSGAHGSIELQARVVRYGGGEDQLRYSWHGDLRHHLHERGRLVLDDGSTLDVVIGRAFLEVVAVDGRAAVGSGAAVHAGAAVDAGAVVDGGAVVDRPAAVAGVAVVDAGPEAAPRS
jgi:hypothetical protein